MMPASAPVVYQPSMTYAQPSMTYTPSAGCRTVGVHGMWKRNNHHDGARDGFSAGDDRRPGHHDDTWSGPIVDNCTSRNDSPFQAK